jgi:hypothetical protein
MSGPDDDLEDEGREGKDDPVALPLEFEEALKALVAVDPADDPEAEIGEQD